MKKKILFVIPSLKSGGAEKSLISVLTLFDYSRYDVDLFVFRYEGLFLEKIPNEVNVIKAGEAFEIFDGSAAAAIKYFLKKGELRLAVSRLKYAIIQRRKNEYLKEKKSWNEMKKSINFPSENYACVIGYLEGVANWFAADFKNAKKKIGYMHSYLDRSAVNKKFFGETIKKLDYFVAVSNECKANLIKEYGGYKNFKVIHNIVSSNIIEKELNGEGLPASDEIKILSVGRLSYEKGPDIAVEACKILTDNKALFKWYHIGTGPQKNEIESLIKKHSLENIFILLGEKPNPYPYFASCDIYVQPSRHEGKSIAVDEAKCLAKPIVVTNFPSAFDQIKNEKNGLICETDANSVAIAIRSLIDDFSKRDLLHQNLLKEKTGNEEELLKLYEMIES